MERILFVFALLLVAAQAVPAGEAPPPYIKKGTWQETLLASREALAVQEAEQSSHAPAQAEEWGPWYHIGPFAGGKKSAFAEAFAPEKEIDLTKAYGKLRWRAHPDWEDGVVHDLEAGENSAIYLYRLVKLKAPRKITAYLGSDDGMVFWLNDKKLLARDVPRGVEPNQEKVELDLAAGPNKLLFKIHNQGGGCGYYFSTSPSPGPVYNSKNQVREKLWEKVRDDFPDAQAQRQMGWEKEDRLWATDWKAGDWSGLAARYARATRGDFAAKAKALAQDVKDAAGLDGVRELYYRSRAAETALARLKTFNAQPLRLAIEDLARTWGEKYPRAAEFRKRLEDLEQTVAGLSAGAAEPERGLKAAEEYEALRQEALLSNPLLDFDRLLFVQRGATKLGLPQNWQGNCAVDRTGYDNRIAVLAPVRPGGRLTTLFKPQKGEFVGDVDLHFDADRMLFSMPGAHGRWQIWELKADGTGLRQATPGEEPDVDNYDPCYLPNGRILYASTATFHGVPCVGGANTVANLFLMDADGRNIRQLCFDQDHNWCPTVMNDGRVLYTRWEYSDTAHYFTRILFRMNPDGTGQMEYYGSNSYWPNSLYYARPIPNDPAKVVAVVSGHHGVPRMGELVILDPSKGRHEADGAVQRIPGYGKPVPPLIQDTLVNGSWPKFLHPYPLSDKYFIVSSQPTPQSLWGIYLVDVFDNMLCLAEVPGYALLEPLPFRKTPTPPVIPDRVKLDSREATVYIADVYEGGGLRGVPRGTVKALRLSEPHYAYPQMGGHINIGVEGPWDVRRIHGTVPVHEDGSASFKVPANTPLTVQPLDVEGQALQLMRSWFVAMPGENLSCIGCHERQNAIPPTKRSIAVRESPDEIKPWYGPTRGFSFKRDVQPVLDQYCAGCHNGARKDIPDLAAKPKNGPGNFTPSYLALHPYVRRPGPESDYHMFAPLEFHPSTSELIQMLRKGHHNVKLDAEAYDRLYTWIDQNVPDHGTWNEHRAVPGNFHQRRLEMRTKYANRPEDPDAIPNLPQKDVKLVQPEPVEPVKPDGLECPGWPFDAAEAQRRQAAAGTQTRRTVELGDGVKMEFVLVPAGDFPMGDLNGFPDERPRTRVKIARPFWMGVTEVTNRQYRPFDPDHDSRFVDQQHKDHTTPGYAANLPEQPVIRISWKEALAFCEWLKQKTGEPFTLPSEAEWEWACRAGSGRPCSYGGLDDDFSPYANLADASIRLLAVDGINPQPVAKPNQFQDFTPKDARFDDKEKVVANAGKYKPNAWGLQDMHGNVWEWTRSAYRPYPYRDDDGRNDLSLAGEKVVRGGSWYDRPARARSSFRLAYRFYQPVFNVGFRVVCPVGQNGQK